MRHMTKHQDRLELPLRGEPGAEMLAESAPRYWNVRTLVGSVAVAGLATVLTLWIGGVSALAYLAWFGIPVFVVTVVLDVLVINRMQFRHYSFTVTPDFVYIARGRIF